MIKNKDVCDKVKAVLSKEPYVVAIFNNGSSIVGMDTPGSDVDFVVILKKEEDKEKIIQILRKTFETFKNEEYPEVNVEEQYDVLGRKADLAFFSQKEIESLVNHFYDSKDTFLKYQHILKHKIVDSSAVYDPKHLLKHYKEKVEKYPQKIIDEVFRSAVASLKEQVYYWEHHGFRNEFQFSFELWDVMIQICFALYVKNRKLFMLPYKRLHKDLKELKPNIEKEMYSLVRGVNNKKNIAKKIEILKIIIAKLEK